jgi:hypothetical protein
MTQRWTPPARGKQKGAAPKGPTTPTKSAANAAKSKSAPKEAQAPRDWTTAGLSTTSTLQPWKAQHLIAARRAVPPTTDYLEAREALRRRHPKTRP